MPGIMHPGAYTALDAARAAQRGAWITAWPADEPFSLPPLEPARRCLRPTMKLGRRGVIPFGVGSGSHRTDE
ncbi:hypothetical protein ACCO45_005464 [Purpureocillium lilacinum]|uniref:Uncharacterized protein n=1 Tax=Purpureocillium lilacinum TaxID=33203 RepID=A0ACC4DWQ0_PURLI